MTNKFKSGLLIFMLVGPLLFFTLFHLFGTNHYNIPKLYPTGVDINKDTVYHQIPEFSFVNQHGQKITKEDYKSKLFVVNFFYTSCPTNCPRVTDNIAYLQESFKNHEDVMFLSHSVDTDFDTEQKLKEYADIYKAKKATWNMVSGNKKDIINQASEGYKISSAKNEGFMHSDQLVLIDKNFVIRGYFDGTNEKEVENLLSSIRILLYEQSE